VFRGPCAEIEIKYETAESVTQCRRCDGNGVVLETMKQGPMILQHQIKCPSCEGKGNMYKKKKLKKKKVKVDIPKGVQNGQTITVEGEGHSLPGKLPGDVSVTIKVKHHFFYTRMGADLCCEHNITVKDALCGFECSFEHVSGAILKYTCKDGVKHNQIKRFKGWGLPQLGGHLGMVGNLLVQFTVIFPVPGSISEGLSAQLKAVLSKLEYDKMEPKKPEISPGVRVQLVNLQNYPEMNGKYGMVVQEGRSPKSWALKLEDG